MKIFEKFLFYYFVILIFFSSFTFLFYKSFDDLTGRITVIVNIAIALLFVVLLLMFDWMKRK
ncbi:MAG: hypothetical protein Q4A42_05365 [Tissierellia bacterium]|nr:hypothetical protein [Tissierellia bacterium]